MLTHANIASNVHSCIKALEETTDDRLTLLLPMFHSFMLTVCIFTPLSMGAGIVLIKSVQPFKMAMREIIRNRATILVGIPQLFQALAEAKIPFWLHWVLKLRLAVSGAAPLPGRHWASSIANSASRCSKVTDSAKPRRSCRSTRFAASRKRVRSACRCRTSR